MLLNELHGVIGEGIRHVERTVVGRSVRLVPQGHRAGRVQLEVVGTAADQSEVLVEAPVRRPVRALLPDMPLAGHQRGVAGVLEDFGNRDAVVVQKPLVRRHPEIADHVADTGLMGIETGQQGRPCRAAAGRVVELSEAQALGRERVQVRGRDLPAVAADIGIA